MPVTKFRSAAEVPPPPVRSPGSDELLRAIASTWASAAWTAPLRFPPGVHRHRTVEEANALSDAWLLSNARRLARRRGRDADRPYPPVREVFQGLLNALEAACRSHYGARLVTLAVFGSAGRGTPRPDSDVDLLLVVDPLPDGRIPRVREFDAVEAALSAELDAAHGVGIDTRLSPVFKTPGEAEAGSPLFLDMVDDARLLVDRDGFFASVLARLRRRLESLGARRVWRGNAWIWDLKPDYRPGDVFEI